MMPRLADDHSGSENDEFPDLDTLVHRARKGKMPAARSSTKSSEASSVRRRKLTSLADNVLLKPWTQESAESQIQHNTPPSAVEITKPKTRQRAQQLKSRKREPTVQVTAVDADEQWSANPSAVEVAFDDKASAGDSSVFHDTVSLDLYDSTDSDGGPRTQYPPRFTSLTKDSEVPGRGRTISQRKASPRKLEQPMIADKSGKGWSDTKASSGLTGAILPEAALVEAINRLRIDDPQASTASQATEIYGMRPETPPSSTPPKRRLGLVSPKKLPRIPTTPHHPANDLFWDKDFVDDWNDEYSPKKQLFPDAIKSPAKQSASSKNKSAAIKTCTGRDARKAFETAKHGLAQTFLEELDKAITHNRLSELAGTTGGIKLRWTNKLNTTAGRANWKRETVRTRNPDGSEASVKYRHHASIELAEKVIDDEHRLLNVIAHEFCHLANFMVSGITNNPHGKEFKAWAAQCSRTFGDRGIEVTTKHSYDIDFKYVWECTSCAMEYKRHSKSINPDRHRCGSCKSQLKQTRPVPRVIARKPSEYQKFMKEQMRLLKEENPKSPQKEIMKQVADRWSSLQASSKTLDKPLKEVSSVAEVAVAIEHLDLDGADGR